MIFKKVLFMNQVKCDIRYFIIIKESLMLFREIIDNLQTGFSVLKDISSNNIEDIVINSRIADESSVFVAIRGFNTDGHRYIFDAYNNGCRDFVVQSEENIDLHLLEGSTVVKVDNSRIALGVLSNYIFDYPFMRLRMTGITGTKGKTTVSTLLHHLISGSCECSLFTTVKNVVCGESSDSVRTTMESNELERLLKKSADCGERSAVVEVSSHAVTLNRIHEVQWDAGIFTSFSRDHLDLYGTMEKYFEAKLDFFRSLNDSQKKNKFAVINIDDPRGIKAAGILDESVRVITAGRSGDAVVMIKSFNIDNSGIRITLGKDNDEFEVQSGLRGEFNVTNITLAVAAALEFGIGIDDIKERLKSFTGIPGRFEVVVENPFTVIVDYAHTPQSLRIILEEGRKLTGKRVILVFGCTGERDREKRPVMGEVASELSDYTIITNDDTYGESPEKIASSVEEGFKKSSKVINSDYSVILDRKQAIVKALNLAGNGDVIILAGMGHEKYQILAHGPVPHNDSETVLQYLKNNLKF